MRITLLDSQPFAPLDKMILNQIKEEVNPKPFARIFFNFKQILQIVVLNQEHFLCRI